MSATNDRELVELAAKAVGYGGTTEVFPSGYVEMGLSNHFDRRGSNVWAPLHDDAQAFHLAVDLRIGADCFVDGQLIEHCCAWANHRNVPGFHRIYVPYGEVPAAAHRRAIVMVAAEIGKAKL
jgi:hypothetical protein